MLAGKTIPPRAVLITRPTEYEALLVRHGTREQARFFLEQRGRSLAEVEARHARQEAALQTVVAAGALGDPRHAREEAALQTVVAAVPLRFRRSRVDRADLDRFVFGPEDIVVLVGQDGLVANVAKYLAGQPVLGINPDRDLYDGVLVRHRPEAAAEVLAAGRGAPPPPTR